MLSQAFITDLTSYASSSIAHRLSTSSIIVGTTTSSSSTPASNQNEVLPSHIKSTIQTSRSKSSNLQYGLLSELLRSSDTIVLTLPQISSNPNTSSVVDKLNEIETILILLPTLKFKAREVKVVLIGSIECWSSTDFIEANTDGKNSGSSSGGGVDYKTRKGLKSSRRMRSIEESVIRLNSYTASNATDVNTSEIEGNVKFETVIVTPGVLYGNGEDYFYDLFERAWLSSECIGISAPSAPSAPSTPSTLDVDGNVGEDEGGGGGGIESGDDGNYVPTTNIDDLCDVIQTYNSNSNPSADYDERYILVIDKLTSTSKQIKGAIEEEINPASMRKSPSTLTTITTTANTSESSALRINLNFDSLDNKPYNTLINQSSSSLSSLSSSSPLSESKSTEKNFSVGFLSKIKQSTLQFLTHRNLKPTRVLVTVPPLPPSSMEHASVMDGVEKLSIKLGVGVITVQGCVDDLMSMGAVSMGAVTVTEGAGGGGGEGEVSIESMLRELVKATQGHEEVDATATATTTGISIDADKIPKQLIRKIINNKLTNDIVCVKRGYVLLLDAGVCECDLYGYFRYEESIVSDGINVGDSEGKDADVVVDGKKKDSKHDKDKKKEKEPPKKASSKAGIPTIPAPPAAYVSSYDPNEILTVVPVKLDVVPGCLIDFTYHRSDDDADAGDDGLVAVYKRAFGIDQDKNDSDFSNEGNADNGSHSGDSEKIEKLNEFKVKLGEYELIRDRFGKPVQSTSNSDGGGDSGSAAGGNADDAHVETDARSTSLKSWLVVNCKTRVLSLPLSSKAGEGDEFEVINADIDSFVLGKSNEGRLGVSYITDCGEDTGTVKLLPSQLPTTSSITTSETTPSTAASREQQSSYDSLLTTLTMNDLNTLLPFTEGYKEYLTHEVMSDLAKGVLEVVALRSKSRNKDNENDDQGSAFDPVEHLANYLMRKGVERERVAREEAKVDFDYIVKHVKDVSLVMGFE